jgi:hypothetical protein
MAEFGEWVSVAAAEELERMFGLPAGFVKFSVYSTAFDTKKDRDGALAFLVDPLGHMKGEVGDRPLRPVAERPDLEWKVVTTINNHHRKLNPRIIFFLGVVDPTNPTVYLTAHKQNEEEPGTARPPAKAL